MSTAAEAKLRQIAANPYIPQSPTPKQLAFLLAPEREVFYGGAAGGAKSSAMLMAALEHVDTPGYAAILFRRTYADLSLPGALMDRAHTWLRGTDAHWAEQKKTWTFPSGATLTFGYLQTEVDKYRYQGAEFHMVGFDELTQFTESMYRYLFSRLRRSEGSAVPIRMRGASNPGGVGHEWCKQRFMVEHHPERRFIPAALKDNPHLDRVEYERSLMELDPFTRAQLLKGDWSAARPYAKFRRHWFEVVDTAPARLNRVRFWDLASTEPAHGKDPDWTAGCLMGLSLEGVFYVLDMRHTQASPKGITDLIVQTAALDGKAVDIWIEQEPGSNSDFAMAGFRQQLLAYSFHPLRATGDKEVRANPFSSQAEAGNVKLVRGPWITKFLDELEAFPSDGEHDDQVDATSGAYGVLADPANAQAWVDHMRRKSEAMARGEYVAGAGQTPPEELLNSDPDGWVEYLKRKQQKAA